MSRGILFGSFAPLHKGHQFLIERAMSELCEVVILIYDDPARTPVPLPVRAAWLRALYPQAAVYEVWDGPVEVGYTPEIMRTHEEFVAAFLHKHAITGITHMVSSEPYGEHMCARFGWVNVQADPARRAVPISGTAIRRDPFAHRHDVHERVYWDLITRVVFLGAPSTGKTTLAEALAQRLESVWVPEYGREVWEQQQVDRKLTPEQLVEIAVEHARREREAAANANRTLFIDTNALTTAQFARDYHGVVPPALAGMADACARRYDLTFLCGDDIPYADTWDRSGTVKRHIFQRQIEADLRMRNIPFIPLTGRLEARIATVTSVLAHYRKWEATVTLS